MMQVALDTTCLQRTHAGTATMVRGMISGMAALDPGVVYTRVQPPFPGMRRWGTLPRKMDTLLKDWFWLQKCLPRLLSKGDFDLFHAPYNLLPDHVPLPFVVNILDLYIRSHPEAFTPWAVKQYRRSERKLREASALFCISAFTRNELLHYCPDLQAEKVKVTPLAPAAEFYPRPVSAVEGIRTKLGVEGPYVLWVGTLEPRKNIAEILEAVQRQQKLRDLTFVLVGGDGWVPAYVQRVQRVVSASPNIIRTGHISIDELAALYTGAGALMFPSYYEGFGLPVLEAMACGCPVIASGGSSLDEVCGGRALQLSAEKPDDWIDPLVEILYGSKSFVYKKQDLQDWAAGFNWQSCAALIRQTYVDIPEDGPHN